jgi:hypothetical protein
VEFYDEMARIRHWPQGGDFISAEDPLKKAGPRWLASPATEAGLSVLFADMYSEDRQNVLGCACVRLVIAVLNPA